jgi:hypothetical protein
MIIRPQLENDLNKREYKFISRTGSKTRFDNLKINNKKIIKGTYFQRNYSGKFSDFIVSQTDKDTGEVTNISSSIIGHYGGNAFDKPANYINPDISNSYFSKSRLQDNTNFQININLFEDDFNLDFCSSLGPLLSLLSGATISIPFQMALVIDSKRGINIPYVYDSLMHLEGIDLSKKQMISLMKSLNVLYKKFKTDCEKEKRNLIIYAFLGDFGVSIRVEDERYNLQGIYELNNSDHCRILRCVDANIGRSYTSSEPFGILLEAKCLALLPSLFSTGEEQNEFLFSPLGNNYETDYF